MSLPVAAGAVAGAAASLCALAGLLLFCRFRRKQRRMKALALSSQRPAPKAEELVQSQVQVPIHSKLDTGLAPPPTVFKQYGLQDSAGQPAPPPPAMLPDGWEVHMTDDGTEYYHNPATGESSWEHPSGMKI